MKSGGIKLNFNFSNRFAYTLIAIFVLAIVGVGVYAYANPTTGVGHSWNEIDPATIPTGLADGDNDDQTLSLFGQILSIKKGTATVNSVTLPSIISCSNGQILKWNNGWACATDSATFSSPLYLVPSICNGAGIITTSLNCVTASCGAFNLHYTCTGSCVSTPSTTCPNTLLGYLVR